MRLRNSQTLFSAFCLHHQTPSCFVLLKIFFQYRLPLIFRVLTPISIGGSLACAALVARMHTIHPSLFMFHNPNYLRSSWVLYNVQINIFFTFNKLGLVEPPTEHWAWIAQFLLKNCPLIRLQVVTQFLNVNNFQPI